MKFYLTLKFWRNSTIKISQLSQIYTRGKNKSYFTLKISQFLSLSPKKWPKKIPAPKNTLLLINKQPCSFWNFFLLIIAKVVICL